MDDALIMFEKKEAECPSSVPVTSHSDVFCFVLQAGKSFKQSSKSSKDSKESKPAKDSKESKSSKDSKEPKSSKDAKQPKPSKDLKEQKPSKDLKSPKDSKEQKKAAPKDPKKASLKDSKELKKALKDSKEQEALKDPKEYTAKKRVTFAEVEPEKEVKASNSEWNPSSEFHSAYPEQNSWTSSFMIFEDENTYWNQGPHAW